MIKNEIEFMHSKIDGIKSEEDLLEKLDDQENKFEKVFTTGQLGISLMKDKKTVNQNGKQFKIVVEHGELFLECIDSFEDIF